MKLKEINIVTTGLKDFLLFSTIGFATTNKQMIFKQSVTIPAIQVIATYDRDEVIF